MDNRLNFIAGGPYGAKAESSFSDVQQWLTWFSPEALKNKGLGDKISIL